MGVGLRVWAFYVYGFWCFQFLRFRVFGVIGFQGF